jgi:hypothetical protein
MDQPELSQKPVDILAKWESTGLLKAARTDHQRKQLAKILENQRLFNATDAAKDNFLKRCSYPIICRIFGNLPVFDLISFQAMDSLEFKVIHKDKYGHPQQAALAPKTRRFGTTWNYEATDDLSVTTKIVEEVSQEISMDLSREIIADLANVAATTVVREWKPSNLFDAILLASAGISKRVGHSANWIVASQPLAMEIAKLEEWVPVENKESNWSLKKVGKLSKKWDVCVDPLLENSNMVLGFRGDEYMSGYYYCPYVPLRKLEDGQLLCRLGKKLIEAGFYARISFENYYTEEEIIPVMPEPVQVQEIEEILDEVPLEVSEEYEEPEKIEEIDIEAELEGLLE